MNAVDYLVKPFGFDRFYSAVDKALARQSQTDSASSDFITVKVDKRLFRVEIDTIRYIESIGDYAKIHMPDKVLISSETLKGYELLLPDHKFVRVHKSYIISIDFVDYLEGNQISIEGVKLPVGKAYRESLKKKFS
ncbi:MAG: LytTR family DNA-binding domain-containing protein [Cyclobacteriaceae bacterium]